MKIIIVAVVVLLVVGVLGLFYLGYKSGEGEPSGLVDGELAACPSSPNCVSSENSAPQGQRVDPLPLTVWDQIPAAISDMGGTVIQQERDYIAAEFRSSIFRFTDDVEFRLAENAVHVRSASRVGHSDMGANRKRVDALRKRLVSD